MSQRIKNLLNKIGDRDEIAAECGVEPIAVYRWAQNASIPSRHFAGVLRVASRNNAGISADDLISAHDSSAA